MSESYEEMETPEAMVVPDSIEPYIGWKALRIREDGQLESPQQQLIWSVKARTEASCDARRDWSWQAIPTRTQANPPPPRVSSTTGTMVFATTAVVSSTSMPSGSMMVGPIETPKLVLPDGYQWSWEPVQHEPAEQNCTCGIYVVSDPRECSSYLRPDCVLCKIALWGSVVPGSSGARGQYAYPQEMFALEHLADVAPLVADLYGIQLSVRTVSSLPGKGRQMWVPSLPPQLSPLSTTPAPLLKIPERIPPPTAEATPPLTLMVTPPPDPKVNLRLPSLPPATESEPIPARKLIEVACVIATLTLVWLLIAFTAGAAALIGAIFASLATAMVSIYLLRD